MEELIHCHLLIYVYFVVSGSTQHQQADIGFLGQFFKFFVFCIVVTHPVFFTLIYIWEQC